ncbi:BrnT family toxin [Chelativorans sp. AA-79]|uniref:BrnT family toxin n=1 Tax=Chelativorans sp. AA-79 TaxID=3028735 RepID=UPI0023F7285E|nr:BrnT family toxin [Chelativorans sp. AA-79]WEX11301.1 BrnT family toxin [Chelativorans sp. AA-79]
MEFEYDPEKSARNRAKHGIDFEEAQALWLDEWLLEVSARTVDEPRYLAIGTLGGKHWTAVFTRRNGRIRLMSVRCSREQEVRHYEDVI